MGDKRLNFNRPLISVRRFSPAVGNAQKGSRRNNNNPGLHLSPSYRSDMHSGPLRNPGTVPFVWEQTPGKPKDETKTQNPPPARVFGRSEDCKNEKPQIAYGPNFLELNDDGDNDDGEVEYDGNGNMSLKFCGLLPQFCLKGSVGMLNQAPGLTMRTRLPLSSSAAITTRVGASSAGSQDAAKVAAAAAAAYQPKSSVKNPAYNNPEEVEINREKKGLVSFQELLAYEIQKEKNFQNHTIEKTLYVDTTHKVESLKPEADDDDDDIFGISHNSNHVCNRSKVDQKVMFCQTVPAPPPLPKSPSDSWLWRSMNSKTASLRSKHKLSSKTG